MKLWWFSVERIARSASICNGDPVAIFVCVADVPRPLELEKSAAGQSRGLSLNDVLMGGKPIALGASSVAINASGCSRLIGHQPEAFAQDAKGHP